MMGFVQELAQLLQEPLQAHVSTRFFAGQQGSDSAGGVQHIQRAAKLAASRKAGQVHPAVGLVLDVNRQKAPHRVQGSADLRHIITLHMQAMKSFRHGRPC